MTDISSIPSGWYPDPADPARKRWWDGSAWTAQVDDVAPLPQSTFGLNAPSRTTGYRPFDSGEYGDAPKTRPGLVWTRSIGWIANQPLWALVPPVIVVWTLGITDPRAMALALLGSNALALIVLLALAWRDRKQLASGGFESTASPWWILLSPLAYLIARSIHFNRWDQGGWGPTVWWIIAAAVAPALAVIGYFVIYGLITV